MIDCIISYQLNSSEASDTQCINDVEVGQLQIGEEDVLRLVPGRKAHSVSEPPG